MTIAFVNGKGGSGKTTVTVCVAYALREAGRRVSIADRDPQGTALEWLAHGATEQGPFAHDPTQTYDVTLIDTPPRLDSPEVRETIAAADKTILVTSPSPTDLWTTKKTVDLVKAVRGGDTKLAVVFNQVSPGTILGRELDERAREMGVTPLFNNIRRRECYKHAALFGWKVLTERAQEEITFVTFDVVNL